MIYFLTTISFILHFIMLFIIVLLSIRMRRLNEVEVDQKKFKRNIEESLSTYLLEMKEENERFLNIFNEIVENNKQHKKRSSANVEKKDHSTKESESITMETQHDKIHIGNHDDDVSEQVIRTDEPQYEPPPIEEEDFYVQSLEAKVLLLKKQGLTTEEIAQKLNKGKTEIELLLKFRQETS